MSNPSVGVLLHAQPAVSLDSAARVYVGFWSRFLAMMIDSVLLLLLMVPVMMVATIQLELGASEKDILLMLTSYLVPVIFALAFWRWKGATPGKMLIRAQIVDARTGGPTSFRQDVIRYLGYLPSSFFLLGFVWAAFDPKKQGWHDKLAGTVVVRRPKSGQDASRA